MNSPHQGRHVQDGCLVNARANRIFLLFQRAFWTFTYALANLLSGAVNLYFYRYEISRLDYQPLLEKWARIHPSLHSRSKTGPGRRRKSSLGIFLRTWKPVGRGVDPSSFPGRRVALFPFPSCFLEMFISVMLFNGFVTNHTLFGKRLHPQLVITFIIIIISKWQQVRLASMWCAFDIFNRFSTRLRQLWFWARKSLWVEKVGYRL